MLSLAFVRLVKYLFDVFSMCLLSTYYALEGQVLLCISGLICLHLQLQEMP